MGGVIFGPFNEDYINFSRAIVSVMLFTLGRIGKLFILYFWSLFSWIVINIVQKYSNTWIEPGKILKYESSIGCMFITLFYIIAIFLSFTVFISFGLSTYNDVMADTGYYSPSFNNSSLKGKFFYFCFLWVGVIGSIYLTVFRISEICAIFLTRILLWFKWRLQQSQS